MNGHVLVTGGAGFIGSHIVDALIAEGHCVRVLDNLMPLVHPGGPPAYCNPRAEYIWADLLDEPAVEAALADVDTVVHQAAAVGVGQSMFAIKHYIASNVQATATLLQAIVDRPQRIRRLVLASSMSVYGEGKYICAACGVIWFDQRPLMSPPIADWEVHCPHCALALAPVPIDERAPLRPRSVYAISKRDQEELCLTVGKAYEIPTIAFRYFGVYGRRQSLSNPYAGLMAMFASRLVNGKAPLVFEDGNQLRDFIHVSDIVRAVELAVHSDHAEWEAYNLGYGAPIKVGDIARILCQLIDPSIGPEVTGMYRKGDIRHCSGDVSKLRRRFGFTPQTTIEEGLADLADWAKESSATDMVDDMRAELVERRILV